MFLNNNFRKVTFLASLSVLLVSVLNFIAPNTVFAEDTLNKSGYAIVATPSVLDDQDWANVVKALQKKYADQYQVETIKWDDQAFDALKTMFPKYACFVIKPEEATIERLATIWQKTRELDSDPYGDVIWSIITGYDANDALRLTQVQPMSVERACGATSIATQYFKSSVVFDEGKQNHWRVKEEGKEEEDRNDAPSDTTHAIADALNDAQLFVTSGHASENNWSLGYSYPNGFFVAQGDKLFGAPSKQSEEKPFLIDATGSKVHLASGNCLWGNIDKPSCMALMMIRHANVDMLMGYVVPTWFGYMGWGVQDYYIEQPGRFTVAESVFANNQALLYLLEQDKKAQEQNSNDGLLSEFKREGLLYDRDVVALYGDPAWQNALANQDSGWKQTLTSEKQGDQTIWTLTIEPLKGEASFALLDGNGSERSNRPIIQLLPQRIAAVELIEGQEYKPVITDDFVLIPLPTSVPEHAFSVKFSAK